MSRYFPIKTETACPLKWSWSTLFLTDRQSASCHRTAFDDLSVENFDQFHNLAVKRQDRANMLDGKWPLNSCSYCREIEEQGGFSDRQLHLAIPNQYPTELDLNPTLVDVTPTILEVYFNNTCNLSCLYCLPSLSSKINQEFKIFGPFSKNGVELVEIDAKQAVDLTEKFWQWMKLNSSKLLRFNVLGGEAFYQSEFYELLDYFEQNPHPNLELGIVTNLMISQSKLESICLRLKTLLANRKLKRIDITCSIDCWGPEQEYVRYGINLEQWEQNFNTLLLSNKWLVLNINQTISVLTIKTMPALLEKLLTWQQIRPVGHYFSVVSPQPSYLKPTIAGPEIFSDDFNRVLALIPENSIAMKYMTSIATQSKQATVNIDELVKLKTFLDEKDRRRNTSWTDTFPWLTTLFDSLNVKQ